MGVYGLMETCRARPTRDIRGGGGEYCAINVIRRGLRSQRPHHNTPNHRYLLSSDEYRSVPAVATEAQVDLAEGCE